MTKEHLSKNMYQKMYDSEWIDLIKEAKQSGISLDEIRMFLNTGSYEAKSTKVQHL